LADDLTEISLTEENVENTQIKFKGFYLLLVHFDKPLTFYGMDEDLGRAKEKARFSCLNYISNHYKQLQAFNKTEQDRKAAKKKKYEQRHSNHKLRFN